MTVRESPWSKTGTAGHRLSGMLLTLCAVLAVLLHHELPGAPVPTASAPAVHHAMSGPASASAAHTRAGPPGPDASAQHTAAAGADGAVCPSMAMECSAAGVSAVQLAAPPESPVPAVPAEYATVAGVDIARSVNRGPPDLSVLSQLRI
ncbi:DUF6153 family protein [Streptomyces acidicola]|uniref:DUF6153 family protein n=1 Tax=Streptomyces acidicola TaxID=2596892 RepID=UPI0037A16BB3